MAPLRERLRLTLGRLLSGSAPAPSPGAYYAVPVTVRTDTSDGADVRLIMEVRVDGGVLAPHDLDRYVHAVTIPAARHWLESHDLDHLQEELVCELHGVAREIRAPLVELGVELLDIELVSAEHLLAPRTTASTAASPAAFTAAAVDGPD